MSALISHDKVGLCYVGDYVAGLLMRGPFLICSAHM